MRDGAPWCTLCLAPTAAPSAGAAPEPACSPGPAAFDPLTAPLAELTALAAVSTPPAEPAAVPVDVKAPVTGGWPCTACGHPNALEVSSCAVCGSGFLARLAAEEAPALKLPVVGDMRRFQRGQPLVLLGLVVSGVLVVLVLIALAGMLLG